MRPASWILCALVCAFAVLLAPTVSRTAVPPNPKDPCAGGGRNTCNTTGVGYYKSNKYGVRWLGDFRNAIPGTSHTFCIDLRFWYPSPDYAYVEDSSGTLRNKDGEAVPLPNQQKIAYATWIYGRSTSADQQAAVALYVHGLMGDARPGEVDPGQFGSAVSAAYDRIKRAAGRYHGPYRIDAKLPAGLKAGKQVTATVRVLAAGGSALPDLSVRLSAQGASGVPAQLQTDASGLAKVTFTPTGGAAFRLSVTASGLASTLPRVYKPSSPAAAPNGQRLVLPSSQTLNDDVSGAVTKTPLTVSTVAVPAEVVGGGSSRDKVTIGSADGWSGTVQVRLYGPFRTTAAISCAGTPAAKTSFTGDGNGATTTPSLTAGKPGWYVYQEVVPGDAGHLGLTTPCNVEGERVKVVVQPKVVTTVSAQTVTAGTPITDTVQVSGLQGEQATVQAALYGPYPKTSAVICKGTPVWAGTIAVAVDGTYQTGPFTPTVPGYYTYRESIAGAGFVRAVQTACGDTAETTILPGKPKITTQVSSQQVKPGATITDRAVVSGLGGLEAAVTVELWGPFASRTAIRCTGTPAWRGTFTALGDGTYTTTPVRILRAGYYTYRESIAAGPAVTAFTGVCGETSETTLAGSQPTLATVVSNEVVRPGSKLTDRIRVQGLGKTPATIEVEVYGPFSTRGGVGCTGKVLWKGRLQVGGDGVFSSPAVLVPKAGFYVFRERLLASALVKGVETSCSDEAETGLGAPLIVTGRGDRTREVRVRSASAVTPTRVRLASLDIDAAIAPVGIDTANGILGVSPDIHRTGWWKDGSEPGSKSGAILIAGHVDSAKGGAGAFFRLRKATSGQRVEVTSSGGRTFRYRVVSARSYLKKDLPTNVYSRLGPARLVLVTCGGPFDRKTGHYRDNIVLTAVPL